MFIINNLLKIGSFFRAQALNVLVLGADNSGKKTFIRSISDYQSCHYAKIERNRKTLNIHDIYSSEIGVRKQYTQYLREADAIIYVIDLSDKNSINRSISDLQNITEFYAKEGRVCHLCLAFNKRDLVEDNTIEQHFLGFKAERFICSFKFKWGESQMMNYLYELMN